jgi:DNA mismatch repair ATPase MutL
MRAATQLVYLNGAPLSARITNGCTTTSTRCAHSTNSHRKVAPQRVCTPHLRCSSTRARQGVIVAQHCERITDCACRRCNGQCVAHRTPIASHDAATATTATRTLQQRQQLGTSATAPVVVSSTRQFRSASSRIAAAPINVGALHQVDEAAHQCASTATTQQRAARSFTEATAIQFSRADIDAWRFVGSVRPQVSAAVVAERQMLIAADQHAVDERINLERLEATVFGDIASVARRCQPLTKGARVARDARAGAAAQRLGSARRVARWGFRYSWLDDNIAARHTAASDREHSARSRRAARHCGLRDAGRQRSATDRGAHSSRQGKCNTRSTCQQRIELTHNSFTSRRVEAQSCLATR